MCLNQQEGSIVPDRRKEKRRSSREFLRVVNVATGTHIGGLGNLSENGALLVSDEPLAVGLKTACKIILDKPILERPEIYVQTRVRWCRKNLKNGWWESGHTLKCDSGTNREVLSYLVMRFSLGEWDLPGTGKIKTVRVANRRQKVRYETKDFFPVRDQETLAHIGGLANITPEGAMLTTIDTVEQGRILKCRVELPIRVFQRDYLFFEAECRWSKKNPNKGWHESGYKFTKISEQDAVIIMHLMMHHLTAQNTEEVLDVVS